MATQPQTSFNDYVIADIDLAGFGRKEIEIAETEMPGLMALRAEFGEAKPLKGARITGSLHMTIQTAVLAGEAAEAGGDIEMLVAIEDRLGFVPALPGGQCTVSFAGR